MLICNATIAENQRECQKAVTDPQGSAGRTSRYLPENADVMKICYFLFPAVFIGTGFARYSAGHAMYSPR